MEIKLVSGLAATFRLFAFQVAYTDYRYQHDNTLYGGQKYSSKYIEEYTWVNWKFISVWEVLIY